MRIRGIWDDRRLSVRDDLRRLSYILSNNRDAFEEFRRGEAEVQPTYSKVLSQQFESSINRQEEVYKSIEACRKSLEDLPFKMLINQESRDKLLQQLKNLQSSIDAIKEASNNKKK